VVGYRGMVQRMEHARSRSADGRARRLLALSAASHTVCMPTNAPNSRRSAAD
jgi:hypothetical protein